MRLLLQIFNAPESFLVCCLMVVGLALATIVSWRAGGEEIVTIADVLFLLYLFVQAVMLFFAELPSASAHLLAPMVASYCSYRIIRTIHPSQKCILLALRGVSAFTFVVFAFNLVLQL
jgi:hypothetical protein